MKLVRFGPKGQEQAGAVDADGLIRSLAGLVDDWTPDRLAPECLKALEAVDLTRLPVVAPGTRLGAPVAGTRQFIAIGLNYLKHAQEAGMEVPSEPVMFFKAITSIGGPDDDVVLDAGSTSTDWEVELGFVVGSLARKVSEADALQHVAGYFLANDVSDRDWQIKRGGQWSKGKSFDGFGPIGPWVATTAEIADPQDIALELRVNGELRQSSNSGDQIFGVAKVLSHLSAFMTLLPGDIVITGTPSGVGLGMKPQQFLKDGDVMELSGGPLGKQRQRVVAAEAVA